MKSYRKSPWTEIWSSIIFMWLFIIMYAVGWLMNIVALFHMTAILTGEGALRIAGIFVPLLGPILGFFF